MRPLTTIAFFCNPQKPGAAELTNSLLTTAKDLGCDTRFTDHLPIPEEFLKDADALCSIGGDGTLLSVAEPCARHNIPIIGVNRGSLGFLTTFSCNEACDFLPRIIVGEYTISKRSLLEAAVDDQKSQLALNDIVIKDTTTASVLSLEVNSSKGLITDYLCDGLIFATPTGSTAYNLSAGGPLIQPEAAVFTMTPICAHTLSNRSIVFDAQEKLSVTQPEAKNDLRVFRDGGQCLEFKQNSVLKIWLSAKNLSLIQKPNYSHFDVIRTKLKWSGSNKDKSMRSTQTPASR